MIKLSIITPYYNTLKEIQNLAKILEPQMTDEVEWLICDDGCNEKELDKLNAKVIHLDHNSGGASVPRNVCLDNANGEYISFIDSDDLVTADYVQKILQKINNEDFDYCFISWDSKHIGKVIFNSKNSLPSWNTCVWNCVYRKGLIGHKRFNTKLRVAEDEDFNKRVRKGNCAYIHDVLYHYSDNPNGITHNPKNPTKEHNVYSNVFYFGHINTLGGVETFFYELVKKYNKYDITILYKVNDKVFNANEEEDQIKRLSKYAKVKKYTGGKVYCKKCFFSHDLSIIDDVIAEEYIEIIHADFKSMHLAPATHPKITKYVGVSQLACDSFKRLTGIKAELCYNPITIDIPTKKIKLLSATRLTPEKGENRMKKLASILDDAKIDYEWDIYTNDVSKINSNNVIYKKPTLNIRKYMAEADFIVQLSDCESYCYTTAESLCLGVPIIVTDLPIFKELGINNSHGIILPLNFTKKDVPINIIKEGKEHFNVNWIPPEDNWESFLDKTERSDLISYEESLVLVEALPIFNKKHIRDNELGRVPRIHERWSVTPDRLKILTEDNAWHTPLVRIVDE